jgi:hypothetical protein
MRYMLPYIQFAILFLIAIAISWSPLAIKWLWNNWLLAVTDCFQPIDEQVALLICIFIAMTIVLVYNIAKAFHDRSRTN